MPEGTCDPATRGQTYNGGAEEHAIGDGYVLAEYRYTWDGVSVRPDCNGPLIYLRVRNTSTITAYALLPNKKKGAAWVEIPAGTDTTINAGTRNQLGLENAADMVGVAVSANQDGSPTSKTSAKRVRE